MKKIILLFVGIYLLSLSQVVAQNYNVNPIPSFNYIMTSQTAYFGEINTQLNSQKEKRDMDVEISTANHSPFPIFAKVWVVRKSGNVVKGPYILHNNQLLSVPIDHGKWGVVIQCTWDVYANVWIN